MKKLLTIMVLSVFVLGFATAELIHTILDEDSTPTGALVSTHPVTQNPMPLERFSPKDRVSEDQIKVYENQIVINVRDAEWATFTNTNSMDPIIDYGANAIEVKPTSEIDIQIGDIVSYRSDYATGVLIHRVVDKGVDSEGTYFVLKGDNNPSVDPGKIRFDQIERVVVAIIY